MSVHVENLAILVVPNGDGALYANWVFTEPEAADVAADCNKNSIAVGDRVKVIESATQWYNGASIPVWVKALTWYVTQITNDRVVLGADSAGKYNIRSPIAAKYLILKESANTAAMIDTLEEFKLEWEYITAKGSTAWFGGSSTTVGVDDHDWTIINDTKKRYWSDTYTPPDNATSVRLHVKPVARTRTVNNNEVEYWTGVRKQATYTIGSTPPDLPNESCITVEIEGNKLTVSARGLDDASHYSSSASDKEKIYGAGIDRIYFQVFNEKVSKTSVYKYANATVTMAQASASWTVELGGEYSVRYKVGFDEGGSTVWSDWSNLTTTYTTIPEAPASFHTCKAQSESSILLGWDASSTATSYEIEYTTDSTLFDYANNGLSSVTVEGENGRVPDTEYLLTGLETSETGYFFRVRAHNDKGDSEWCPDVLSAVIGSAPAVPTTWSSTSTAVVGEELILYWSHNSEDGSTMQKAVLSLVIKDKEDKKLEVTLTPNDEENEWVNGHYSIDTAEYSEGAKIEWKVCTYGVFSDPSDWSVTRTVEIYAKPYLTMELYDSDNESAYMFTKYPITVRALAGPNTQTPLGFHVAITANEAYQTTDNVGNDVWVAAGEQVYSHHYDGLTALYASLSPGNVSLEDGQTYTLTCTVSMNTGLTAQEQVEFTTDFGDGYIRKVDAVVTIDQDVYTATILPRISAYDASISVYRREYDGSFTEIASGEKSGTTITDPHPALDYARYRIVATCNETGAVRYSDIPAYPVGCTSILIQWDEKWQGFAEWSEDEFATPLWSGSMLKLPYNIDVSENTDIDTALISYIGRAHPVSYYGTQLGETATWNTDIPKSDKDTIYALRRLAKWKGDAYVREPSGVGYWANVKVSFSQKHTELTVPVTLTITRVEGGA